MQILNVLLLVFGFGFVIFFHELGHFLAAKWADVKVEQFAVGFGQAIFSWRKGLGFTWGSSGKELEKITKTEQEGIQEKDAKDVQAIGETEYRLNWIPLGGYVKMLGQDDLKPGVTADDPRAYNNKPIRHRMVIVSAGVVMNIILAAVGFMVIFLMGFNAPPAIVGNVVPGSPADKAGLEVGQRIIKFDGNYQHDFTKIFLTTALAEEGVAAPILLRNPDGSEVEKQITPMREAGDPNNFLMLGITQGMEMRAAERLDELPEEMRDPALVSSQLFALKPGDVITHVNDKPVEIDQYYLFDRALQESQGEPVKLTVRNEAGDVRTVDVLPVFQKPFGNTPLNFAGLMPRPAVNSILPESAAKGQLLPGDAIVALISSNGDQKTNPTTEEFIALINTAGSQEQTIDLLVARDGKPISLKGIKANVKLGGGRYGLGIGLGYDRYNPIAAVLENSPAKMAGIPTGAEIRSIDGQKINDWFDIQKYLGDAKAGEAIEIVAHIGGEEPAEKTFTLTLDAAEIESIASYRYTHELPLNERIEPRKTNNPLVAAGWGVTETRDFVLQFYLTLQRMFQGSVSYTNMMGPVGIFHAGTKIADRGSDWLIWFLAMISANLAVVNFLPIPIVDGGLFTFLVIEKIQGKPISQRVQSVAQVVGLALILGIFLLVTYQDIARML